MASDLPVPSSSVLRLGESVQFESSPYLSQTNTFVETEDQQSSSHQQHEDLIKISKQMETYGNIEFRDPPTLRKSGSMELNRSRSPSTVDSDSTESEQNVVPDISSTTPNEHQVKWDGPNDPENPQNWSRSYKWFLTLVCSSMTINVTFASSAPTATIPQLVQQFDIPTEVANLITSTFLLGYVFGPFFWGPGSEVVGRRPIFLLTLTCYTLLHLGQALAPNPQILLITRFFAGFFAVAPLTNCGGIIADIWPAVSRGPATNIFSGSVFLGPMIGPIISGFMMENNLNWRWVFWIMMIYAGACTAVTIVFLPETFAPVLLAQKAKRLRAASPDPQASQIYAEHEKQDWSISGVFRRTIYRPFEMLAKEPILVLVTVYLSLVYGLMYALFEALPIIFVVRRGFTPGQVGLIFIGVGIGTSMGALINYLISREYPQLLEKWRGFPPPEERLRGAAIGAPILVIGCFWLGWTGEYSSIHWVVPALATILIGLGVCLVFMSFLSYLMDTYLMYSASAFAANTTVRSLVAAVFPLFTVQMFNALGINWACTLIGLTSLLLAPSPFLFMKFGPKIRTRSTFAPCIDLRIASEIEAEEKRQNAIQPEVVFPTSSTKSSAITLV